MANTDSTDGIGPEDESGKQSRQSAPIDPISQFFKAIVAADMPLLEREYANAGAYVNIQEPGTKATALHYAAGFRLRPVLRWLAGFRELDYLLLDCKGRLPSVVAYEVAHDPVIGRYLMNKEHEQARARGIDILELLAS